MARITVEDCLTRENNRFSLVLLAAKRAKQLLNGSKLMVKESKNKAVVSALREIAAGKVRFMSADEAAAAAAEDQRLEEERQAEAASAAAPAVGGIPFVAPTASSVSSGAASAEDDDDEDDDEVAQPANR